MTGITSTGPRNKSGGSGEVTTPGKVGRGAQPAPRGRSISALRVELRAYCVRWLRGYTHSLCKGAVLELTETKNWEDDLDRTSNPTRIAAEAARDLQLGVMADEMRQLENPIDDYSKIRANQNIIHSRQDIILIYSMITSVHHQSVMSNRILAFIAIILFLILVCLLSRMG